MRRDWRELALPYFLSVIARFFRIHVWHKLPHPGYATVPRDQVMFVGSDSRWLARATVRRPARAALDLCTGSGIQALLATPHSERVLAVDINHRAARSARFNATISGATNFEVAEGNLFEQASATDRFDLITANPPFVSSPVDVLMFRDGGPSGEAILERIVQGLPLHLAAGGIAQIVTELGEREGEPIVQRVRQWLDGAPMDIHILRLALTRRVTMRSAMPTATVVTGIIWNPLVRGPAICGSRAMRGLSWCSSLSNGAIRRRVRRGIEWMNRNRRGVKRARRWKRCSRSTELRGEIAAARSIGAGCAAPGRSL